MTNQPSKGEKEITSSEYKRQMLFLGYGRNLRDACLHGDIDLSTLNAYELHAIEYSRKLNTPTWDERNQEELEKLKYEINPLIMKGEEE